MVDDEPLLRMDLAEMLQEAGYKTIEAGHAAEAIQLLEQNPEITAVFTDIQMPGSLDGLALSHVVRDRWPPTAIIVCSGNRRPEPIDMPSGAYFLAKPIGTSLLTKVLEDVAGSTAR